MYARLLAPSDCPSLLSRSAFTCPIGFGTYHFPNEAPLVGRQTAALQSSQGPGLRIEAPAAQLAANSDGIILNSYFSMELTAPLCDLEISMWVRVAGELKTSNFVVLEFQDQ